MRILKRILVFLASSYLVVAPVYLTYLIRNERCRGVNIYVNELPDFNLITEREIYGIINSGNPSITGTKLKDLRICDIEDRLKKLHELRVVEVYFTVDGNISIYALQRNPILRVFAAGGDYFLDDEGVLIRKKRPGTPRLHVAGGNITVSQKMLNGISVLDTAIKKSVLKDLYHIIKYIRNDRFWSAQIDQIWVDGESEINLIPRTGNHIIHLGSAEDFVGKLENLEAFYTKILPLAGWDTYKRINLEFKGQIVCNKYQ
ncbi:MAG TPA: hypothetical protein PL101_00685 [Bacteroidales bacterium]|nr:hypothetical protein [Bacteroidales bacterium]